MSLLPRSACEWRLRTRALALGTRTLVMGVLNVTPDSFSDGGRYLSPAAAVESALAMFEQGAAIVDVGGESTRPGERETIGAAEEIDRILPVIEDVLRHRPGSILSADTYKAETARAALGAGVEIVNDVSGFLWEPPLAKVCAEASCAVVLMHTRGRPNEWRHLPQLAAGEIVAMVGRELRERRNVALAAGICRDRIVLDPGFGFGKRREENYALLAALGELRGIGQPLLAGLSRKSFLGHTVAQVCGPLAGAGSEAPPAQRENASVAAAAAAVLAGADIVRAHDVAATVEAVAVADAVLSAKASR